MVSYIHTNLPVNVTVIQPHPLSGDSQGHETVFLLIMKPATMTQSVQTAIPTCIYIWMNFIVYRENAGQNKLNYY